MKKTLLVLTAIIFIAPQTVLACFENSALVSEHFEKVWRAAVKAIETITHPLIFTYYLWLGVLAFGFLGGLLSWAWYVFVKPSDELSRLSRDVFVICLLAPVAIILTTLFHSYIVSSLAQIILSAINLHLSYGYMYDLGTRPITVLLLIICYVFLYKRLFGRFDIPFLLGDPRWTFRKALFFTLYVSSFFATAITLLTMPYSMC